MTLQKHFPVLFLLTLGMFCLAIFQPKQKQTLTSFQQFKSDFMKTYTSSEQEFYRKVVFTNNLRAIEAHNSDPTQTHKLGLNSFADLTQQEFIQIYLKTQPNTSTNKINTFQTPTLSQQLADNKDKNDIDWVARGNVSPVKNQGVCGSCWAFSAAQALQSSYSIYKNVKVYLSQQQLVECSSSYGNNGCNGGKMENAFNYIKDNGLSTQKQYPYVGRQQQCKRNYGDYKISQYVSLSDCTSLSNALQQRPISVGVDASTWALYRQGILTVCGHNINHGVLLVGAGDGYWKIKNSWGANWGQNGYIRIAKGNTCAVCENPLYPVL